MKNNFPKTMDSLKKHGIFAKKSLGQNFLTEDFITDKIASFVTNIKDKVILEIGPGPAGLTKSLLNAGAKSVIAIEKDERFIAILKEISDISGGKVQIVNADALRVKEEDFLNAETPKLTIVANLPYNIATGLLIKWLEKILPNQEAFFDEMILMFQKEVVERITAEAGSSHYGRLAILCNWLCETEELMEIGPEFFTPPPKITSAVVRIKPRKKPAFEADRKNLENLTRHLFNQRRKTISNCLKKSNASKEEIGRILQECGIKENARAEEVSIEKICLLSTKIAF